MHWVEVDGYRLPKQIAGHPALEFCNTRAMWSGPWTPDDEWLDDYQTLVTWTAYTGLITDGRELSRTAAARPEAANEELDEVRRLRAALYPVLLGDEDAERFAIVAEAAERAAGRCRLTRLPEGGHQWRLRDQSRLDVPRDLVALAAARWLCDPHAPPVKACAGEDCDWLFPDKRGRRRWCDMATCGNRAKARAFARRAKED